MADPRILASMRKLLDTARAAGQARPSFGPPGGGSQSPAPEIRCWTFGRGRNSPEPSEGRRGGCPVPRNSSADRGSCKRGPWRRPGFISDAPGRILCYWYLTTLTPNAEGCKICFCCLYRNGWKQTHMQVGMVVLSQPNCIKFSMFTDMITLYEHAYRLVCFVFFVFSFFGKLTANTGKSVTLSVRTQVCR